VPFTPANLDLARETIAKYPQKKSAVLPLLHLAQNQEGHITPDAIEEIADLLDLTPALVLGTCSFYTMFKLEPAGSLVVCLKTLVAASKPNDDNTPDASAPQCQPVKRLTQESGD